MSRLNRHAQKRRHKQKLEQQYTNKYGYSSVHNLREKKMLEAEEDHWWNRKHPPRNNGWEYWRIWYLTGPRQYAKKYTDKRIRQKYRRMIKKFDPDEVTAPKGADYEKEYDYAWTIW